MSGKPVVVIGAGPAGLSCPSRLTAAGQRVVLIEENRQAGGQYFCQLPPSYREAPRARLLRETGRYRMLAGALKHPLAYFLPSTAAWGNPGSLSIAYAGPKGSGRIEAKAVVIATGAQDKPFPFTGWTLPGVLSAGGCLSLLKAHGLMPQGRVVMAGNGPLLLVAGAALAHAGARVTHVAEAQQSRKLASAAFEALASAPGLLLKGICYRSRIAAGGARFLSGWMVTRAEGDRCVRRVGIAPVSSGGTPDMGRERFLDAETLVVGYGLLPGTEFASLMGCRMTYAPDLGGWVPARSELLETSVPGVYAAGDCAGIGGVEVALMEGEQAAHSIVFGAINGEERRRYLGMDRFRRMLNAAYLRHPPLASAGDDTIVCRCEELKLGELRAHLAFGTMSLDELKTATRLGMGRCQGRNCFTSVASLCGFDSSEAGLPLYPRVRPPVRPVPLERIAADRQAGPAREPDEIDLFAANNKRKRGNP